MSTEKVRCDWCGSGFVLGGWVSTKAGATTYAGIGGLIRLCSSSCEQHWTKAKAAL